MRLVGLCLAALLAGCVVAPSPPDLAAAPQHLATAPAAAGPALAAEAFIAADGAPLPLRAWLPPAEPRAVILALHGFNDYSNAFAGPGSAWAAAGIATYAYDQRGFGGAPERGRWAGARQLAGDATDAIHLLRQRHPGVPLYLLGESMGGAIAILAASGRSGAPVPRVEGVILVAPAVWGRATMSVFERVGLWLADFLPAVGWSPNLLPVRISPSDNIAMLRALGADPLVIKRTRADTLNGLVDLMSAALNAAPWFEAPLLLLYGERDEIVPHAPMARFVAALPARARARERVALYPQGYHMLLRDLGAAAPIGDIAAWIGASAAALSSGADAEARRRPCRRNGACRRRRSGDRADRVTCL
ncbi:MAG TPA: alpha/beta hydrolase [Stellaceae bacterium]|nr:alpha/beta hydrolase [Stellaceae bacterium]